MSGSEPVKSSPATLQQVANKTSTAANGRDFSSLQLAHRYPETVERGLNVTLAYCSGSFRFAPSPLNRGDPRKGSVRGQRSVEKDPVKRLVIGVRLALPNALP